MPCVAYGIGARSAGVGYDGYWATNSQRLSQIKRLPLRLILQDARGLLAKRTWSGHRLTIISFAEIHAATRCAQYNGQLLVRFPGGLRKGVARGQEQEPGCTIESSFLTFAQVR